MVDNLVNSVVGSIYISADKRTILDKENITAYQPLSNNNVLFVYLENAFGNSGVATASFKSGTKRIPTSQPFFLRFVEDVNKVVNGDVEPRHFSKYILTIPQPVANLNLNNDIPMNISVTINVSSSISFIGIFDSLIDLENYATPTARDIAYVIESGIYGYYEYVLDNGSLKWLKIENDDITRKVIFSQYGFFNIGIQGGYFSEVPHTNINDWQEYVIWQEISATNLRLAFAETNIGDLQVDLGEAKDRIDDNGTNIGSLDGRVTTNEEDINNLKDRVGTNESDISGLDGRVGVNETDIYNLESDVGNLQSDKADKTELIPIENELARLENDKVDKTVYNADKNAQQTKDNNQDNKIDVLEIDVSQLQLANMFKSVTFNGSNGHLTFTKFDGSTHVIDLPTELIVTSGVYDDINNELVLNLANGTSIRIPVGNLLTDIDAEHVRYNGAGTYYLTGENRVENAINELDTQVKTVNDNKVDKSTYNNDIPLIYAELLRLEDDKANKSELVASNVATSEVGVSVQEALDELKNVSNYIIKQITEYGVREVVGQSASELERVTRLNGVKTVGDATGLVANVSIDGALAENSFDFIPIFQRTKENIIATDLSANDVSNTFVKVRKYYIKEEWVKEGGIDYHYLWMCETKLDENYRLPLPFKKPDGSERDYAYIGAYEAYLDGNNKLRSLTGQIPKVSYSRNNFRTAARALDGLGVNSKYQITDLAEYVDLVQIPFIIEFATKHSQGVFLGATSMAYSASHTAIAEGTGVNFIVVSNATGDNFVLGQTVSIGTSNSDDSIAIDRIVTQIQVDTPNAGETTITFDGATVNIAIGNVIASRTWKTGMTDGVKVSGTHALNDGKHSIVWRGLENPFGNIWKNVDGVKISNWRGYITENPKDYNDTESVAGVYAEPYLPLGYLNANANNYVQELGYDANYPYAKFPISVQASDGLFFRDYYYQNSGDKMVFVGGDLANSSNAGLFNWNLIYGLGNEHFNRGARLSYRP